MPFQALHSNASVAYYGTSQAVVIERPQQWICQLHSVAMAQR
jgi:hypothetical protein